MSRAFDFVVAAVIYLMSAIIHRMAVALFNPNAPLHEVATEATTLNGAARADQWYQTFAIWVPLIAVFGISAWVLIREYRRQQQTAVVGRGGGTL